MVRKLGQGQFADFVPSLWYGSEGAGQCGKTGGMKKNLNEDDNSPELKQKLEKVNSDIYFKNLGGVGLIECNECDFSKSVTSFSHGEFAQRKFSTTGYQCE